MKTLNAKRFFVFGLVALLSLTFLSPQSYALLCKNSQGIDGPSAGDECWTQVRVSPTLTEYVSAYTVMMYDFTLADTTDRGSFYVRPIRASSDWYRVAGVTQSVIATGDYGMVLVRGKGKINLTGQITSGSPLFVTSRWGFAGSQFAQGNQFGSATSSDPMAIALESAGGSVAQATIDAYMIIR